MPDARPRIPQEVLVSLRDRLETLPARHADRKDLVGDVEWWRQHEPRLGELRQLLPAGEAGSEAAGGGCTPLPI
jgi:hypothetical protein